jgi:hypothetical protein
MAPYSNNSQSDKERILKITGQQKKVFHPQLPRQYRIGVMTHTIVTDAPGARVFS